MGVKDPFEEVEYYVIVPVFKGHGDTIANASVGICQLCSGIATGMGGSPYDICKQCGDLLVAGKLRSAVKWGSDDEAGS